MSYVSRKGELTSGAKNACGSGQRELGIPEVMFSSAMDTESTMEK
jgi:hypothetical protein